ncbi:DUF58 domain-containing protein [Halobellus clavatus]|uniref:DUF58 domain-containing protein n=1 Tax=Halobellus clavatus TaxID=660517 RepID=A0A1H3J5C6_9EURY|nr:DUF58 domain-containing protein [Halobellus clavatus]SDY35131.1 Protein of unknown function DUF58 [Halobellus clavatus]
MQLTRRGYAVLALVVASVAAGATFGPRSLDAVVLPGIVALVAAAVQVWRAPTPTVERRLPPADIPGTTGTIELRLEAPRTYPATVRDRLPDGVATVDAEAQAANLDDGANGTTAASDAVCDATVGGSVTYEVTRLRRGAHEIGPVTVTVSDVLGLFERAIELDCRSTLVVYPRTRRLAGTAEATLRALARSERANRRDEFDVLREYVRGDPQRDVHWKSSAKRGELMIREFTAETDPEQVVVAAGVDEEAIGRSDDGRFDGVFDRAAPAASAADAMAEAAATVSVALVREGATVSVRTPSGEATASPDRTRGLLEHLAVVEEGRLPDETDDVDVAVVAFEDGVTVRFDDRTRRFEDLIEHAEGEHGRADARGRAPRTGDDHDAPSTTVAASSAIRREEGE